jgi:hypothetical protein
MLSKEVQRKYHDLQQTRTREGGAFCKLLTLNNGSEEYKKLKSLWVSLKETRKQKKATLDECCQQ